jgi:hypothetical protein
MWSGFNLMANLALWRKLPADIQTVIERNATKYVRLQREDQGAFNGGLRKTLTERGMVFNDVDQDLFRTWPLSMPSGKRNLDPSAGPCSKGTWASSVEARLTSDATSQTKKGRCAERP